MLEADCPAGKKVVGGGSYDSNALEDPENSINSSSPNSSDNGWVVYMNNTDTSPFPWTVYAICVAAS